MDAFSTVFCRRQSDAWPGYVALVQEMRVRKDLRAANEEV